jgi:hypothetical protein
VIQRKSRKILSSTLSVAVAFDSEANLRGWLGLRLRTRMSDLNSQNEVPVVSFSLLSGIDLSLLFGVLSSHFGRSVSFAGILLEACTGRSRLLQPHLEEERGPRGAGR